MRKNRVFFNCFGQYPTCEHSFHANRAFFVTNNIIRQRAVDGALLPGVTASLNVWTQENLWTSMLW
jgi:hypothetical protein